MYALSALRPVLLLSVLSIAGGTSSVKPLFFVFACAYVQTRSGEKSSVLEMTSPLHFLVGMIFFSCDFRYYFLTDALENHSWCRLVQCYLRCWNQNLKALSLFWRFWHGSCYYVGRGTNTYWLFPNVEEMKLFY